jgi:hypothetical protein
MTRVEEIWREIGAVSDQPGVFRRVDENHPLDVYAGLDHRSKRVLMLITAEQPPSLPPTGIVQITCNQRGDGDFATVLQLVRPEYDELFGRLCQDLVDATRSIPPEKGAAALLLRLGRWRRLLEVGPRGILSDVALRGLIGELWFLRSVAIPRFGADGAVTGWLGPLDSPQDFSLGGTVIEIKTCNPGSQQVTISSLQQLDVATEPFYLAVVWVAPADKNTSGAFSVAELVASIRSATEAGVTAGAEFAFRLIEAGYNDCDEYDRMWFRILRLSYFRVEGDFPRLKRSIVPFGILDMTYTIDLAACDRYQAEPYGGQ